MAWPQHLPQQTLGQPIGENRDYSLRPVGIAVAKSVGWFAAAILWAALMAYVVRRNYVPDTWLGAGVVFGPSLVLLATAAIYLVKAMMRFQFGDKPPAR